MAVRVTFSLDEETVNRLRAVAERVRKPQSQVVREAVAEYAARADRLSDSERAALLRTFDRVVPAIPARPAREVDRERREVRAARRQGGRGGRNR
ncbi:MAG TPA: ribbon-helix-helix domain-containing protein [Vicinamibacterales bacterium]|nr:ribbon-helix-helix domain-containing protein [Vicinamibacterales bacterium]